MEEIELRKVGRRKLRWNDVIQKYTKEAGVQKEEAQGLRIVWRTKLDALTTHRKNAEKG